MSPNVLVVGGYRIVIYTADHGPAHVHVISADRIAKVYLTPVTVVENRGYLSRELRKIERIIIDNRQLLLDAWNEIHGGSK